jgi:hypothetical protein
VPGNGGTFCGAFGFGGLGAASASVVANKATPSPTGHPFLIFIAALFCAALFCDVNWDCLTNYLDVHAAVFVAQMPIHGPPPHFKR